MITAVDTNVLLDVFGADPEFGQRSAAALRACLREGRLVACEVVWAETASFFPSPAAARGPMERLEVGFSPLDLEAALAASGAWRKHRAKGGRRERVAADFLIGAHAQLHADRLLTRDRGFYRACFSRLKILDPSAAAL
jgi:Predicted nucleic acid-binding protein, contains PIN domain